MDLGNWYMHIILINSPWRLLAPRAHHSHPPLFEFDPIYNHARGLRLKKLLHLELSGVSIVYLKPLQDPGGGFRSETACYAAVSVSEAKRKRPQKKMNRQTLK
jgi:hypothetical protein